jgi:N-methylhydantoinase A
MRLDRFDAPAVEALYAEMRSEANAVLAAAQGGALTESRLAYMRYVGQGHEIAVPIEASSSAGAGLAAAFERVYAGLYGRTIPDMAIEALTWSLTLMGPRPRPAPSAKTPPTRKPDATATRRVFDASREAFMEHRLFDRARLSPGDAVDGPALIVEDQTTTIVTSAFAARVDGRGNLILERNKR